MINEVLLILLLSLTFYLILPGFGAFRVRRQWRRFRSTIQESSRYPRITYKDTRSGKKDMGSFRFFGELRAMQGEDRIWLSDGSCSVAAELKGVQVYLMPGQGRGSGEDNSPAEDRPKKISWNRIFSLQEGTKVFIFGRVFTEASGAVFRNDPETPLLVVVYDGDEDTLLYRAIRGGRHRNEYWNYLTPGSLTAGSFSLFIAAYVMLRSPDMKLPVLLSLTGSLFPLIPLLPPGVVLYTLYRRFWRIGRTFRAERDLVRLPMRYFPSVEPTKQQWFRMLPDGGIYQMERIPRESGGTGSAEGVRIRSITMYHAENRKSSWFLFKADYSGENGEGTTLGKDPMAEDVLIPGDPLQLAGECERKAFSFEIMSMFFFGTCFVMNGLIVLLLLRQLLF